MKIKNVSAKVVGILGKALLPDEETNVNHDLLKNKSIDACIKAGLLSVDDSEERAEEIRKQALAEARAQIEAEMKAEEKPIRRRRKVESEEAEVAAE